MKNILLYLSTFCSLASWAQGPNVCLSSALNSPFATGQYPRGIAVADFNTDGKPDIVTVNQSGYNVSLLLGSGTGSFGAATNFSVGSNPYAVISSDFNNDGKADIAACNNQDNNISVLLGNGAGSFTSNATFSVSGNMPGALTAADLNNDGNKDIITADNNNNISVLFGSGNGSFGPAIQYMAGMTPQGVVAADFNNDGNLDVAVANRMSNNISLLIGSPSGTLAPAVNFAAGALFPCSIASADFNGDGNTDLVTGNFNGNNNNATIFLGTGTGSFTPSFTLNNGQYAIAVAAGDINGDNKADFITVNNADIQITLGLGNGTFAAPITYTNGGGMNAIAVKDLNNDGRKDIAMTNSMNNDVTVLLNRSAIVSTSGPTTFCAGGQVVLRCTKGGNSYLWSPGGATADSVVVNASGVYSVSMTNGLCVSASNNVTVIVNPLPSLSVAATNTAICPGQSATLTASGANTYTWTNGPVNATSVVSPTANAVYTVTGTNGNGCIGSTTKSITVNSLPSLSVAAASSVICTGQSATLTASGANTYTWTNGPVNAISVVSPTANTTYTVTGTNGNGCSSSMTKSIVVNAAPSLSIASSGTAICAGQSATLTASGANTYTWTNGPVNAISVVSPTANAIYTVTGTNGNGCSSSMTKSLVVNALPNVSITGNNTVCAGSGLLLTGNGAVSYTWSNGPVSPSIAVNPTVGSTYSVNATGANGCSNSANISVSVMPVPTVNIVSSQSVTCAGECVTVTASGANTYSWNNGFINPGFVLCPTVSTTYSVTGTTGACSSTAAITVTVNTCTGISKEAASVVSINVYPNPNNGSFSIRAEQKSDLRIVNELGQTIEKIELTEENNFSYEIKNLSPGIYFLVGNGSSGKKIVANDK